MSIIGNLLWLLFGGLLAALGYFIAGCLTCLTIVGIPFGIQSIKLAGATLIPMGREIRTRDDADTPLKVVFNILWLVLFGWELALHHLLWVVVLGATVIGIPFALQHFKLFKLSLWPFGREFS